MEVKQDIRTRASAKLLKAGATALALALIALLLGAAAASAKPKFFAVSKESACLANQNVNAFLRSNHANVLRLILSPQNAGAGVACVKAGHDAGFKVYISLQFKNNWTPRQVAAYFRRVLPSYVRYLWAIGVGNEQDLSMPSDYGQGTAALSRAGRSAGQNYRAVWNAVEPVLVKLAPHTIRVYGEFSPWSFSANQQGFAAGRPRGVQAIGAHCYHTTIGGLMQVPQDAAWAASRGLPLWCSEMGPALKPPTARRWVIRDSWGSWNALVGRIERASPNLKMAGYYYDPAL